MSRPLHLHCHKQPNEWVVYVAKFPPILTIANRTIWFSLAMPIIITIITTITIIITSHHIIIATILTIANCTIWFSPTVIVTIIILIRFFSIINVFPPSSSSLQRYFRQQPYHPSSPSKHLSLQVCLQNRQAQNKNKKASTSPFS